MKLSNFGEQTINFKATQEPSKDVMQEYDKLKNLSHEEASAKLYQEVYKQKQNGTFDFENLSRQVEGLKSFLPEKDFANLKRILETLR